MFFTPYTQPPRTESILWREQHYVCLFQIFPRCNIWSEIQSMQFSTPSFQDILMGNKCGHIKVHDSHVLFTLRGKAFDSCTFSAILGHYWEFTLNCPLTRAKEACYKSCAIKIRTDTLFTFLQLLPVMQNLH